MTRRGPATQTFCGRTFSPEELALMREVTADCPGLGLTELARTVCELLDWTRPSGRLKTHECRQLLTRLHDDGWLTLPPLHPSGPHGPRQVRLSPVSEPPPDEPRACPTPGTSLAFSLVPKASPESHLWTELLARYHYQGARVPVGASLRYLVRAGEQVVACLLWTSPAWALRPRDHWIGWSLAQRRQHLQQVVNHGRFLILPWIRVKGLASQILAQAARQVPHDWTAHYGVRPLLLETCVDTTRFAGTCYRAANWIPLGHTQGRGRMDRQHHHPTTPKLVLVYPLHRRCRDWLCHGIPDTR